MIKYVRMLSGEIGVNGTPLKPERVVELLNQSVKDKEEIRDLKLQVQKLLDVGETLDHFDRYEVHNVEYQQSPFKKTVSNAIHKWDNIAKAFFTKYPYLKKEFK